MKITAIIITRNEEENIRECIKTLSFADEILVIDNNSTDKTVELAKELNAKTHKVAGLDFSYFRNVGKEKAKNDWLFYIDADERATKELAKEIKETVRKESRNKAYKVRRENYFFGTIWPYEEKIVRLIKKDNLIGWHGVIHETPTIAGEIGQLEGPLLHLAHRDLTSMVQKTNEWSEFESQLRYKSNHPPVTWWRLFRVMVTGFLDSYIKQNGWKAGSIGLLESIYQSFSMFITYAKLWEKQNKSEITKSNL